MAALARQAGLDAGVPVAGAELDALSDPELDRLVARTTVFGRIAPEQKERLVESLRRQGRYVAMIGDGVNDARALKRAHVGVAMKSGSAVARDVADIVLTDDSLAALRPAQHEGRRIINGIGTSMQVFLARVGTQGLVILAVTMLGLGFPYSPAQRRADAAHRRRPDPVPDDVGAPDGPRSAPAGQPGPVRRPRRGAHGGGRRRRSTPTTTRSCSTA